MKENQVNQEEWKEIRRGVGVIGRWHPVNKKIEKRRNSQWISTGGTARTIKTAESMLNQIC